MTTRAVLRARTSVLALCIAGGGLLALPAAPAQAGVFDTPELETQVSFSAFGPGTCTASGPGPTNVGPVPFAVDGVAVTSTGSSSRTYTNDGNAADVTTLTSTMTSTIAVKGTPAALTGFTFHSTSQSTVSSALGTAQQCGAQVTTLGSASFKFDLAAPRAVTLDTSGSGTVQVVFQRLIPATPTQAVVITNLGGNANGHVVKILPPGTWQAQAVEQSQLSAPKPTDPTTSVTGEVSAEVSFSDPGAATGPATGDGGKYLKTADARTCAAGSLASTWSSKAGKGDHRKVKKATFLVNGVKKTTVKKPKKGQVTTLTGLTAGKPLDLEVRIKLAKKGAGTVTVERSYILCP